MSQPLGSRDPHPRVANPTVPPVATLLSLVLSATPGDRTESVGFYAKGELRNGVPLAVNGRDHYLMYPPECYTRSAMASAYSSPSRMNNFYGHPSVIAAIGEVGAAVRKQHPLAPKLSIGELSNRRGGKIPYHYSHQTGLDVDIDFLENPPRVMYGPKRDRVRPVCGEGPRYEVRVGKEWTVGPNFKHAWNWTMASTFAAREDVKVIFIGKLLRADLEGWAKKNVSTQDRLRTLKKLRAPKCPPPRGHSVPFYENNLCPHDDHIHVRFHCPADSPRCRESRRRKRPASDALSRN